MNISWYGLNCFKLQGKTVAVVTDPFGKEVGLKPPMGAADVVLVSENYADANNAAALKDNPFVVDGPGEYEVKHVIIRGIDLGGGKTAYRFVFEGIRFCHLGNISADVLTAEQMAQLGEVDVLFVPVGDVRTLNAKQAEAVINQIEARVVIPMHFQVSGLAGEWKDLDSVESFIKEYGAKVEGTVSKLSLRAKDLPVEETQFVVMDLGK